MMILPKIIVCPNSTLPPALAGKPFGPAEQGATAMLSLRIIFAATLAALLTFGCGDTASESPSQADIVATDSSGPKADSPYATDTEPTIDTQPKDTKPQPTGCEASPWLYDHIGEAVACAPEDLIATGEANHCYLELYESDGKCVAKCQPAFHEYVSNITQTETGFCMQKPYGQIFCSFGAVVKVE